MIWSTLAVYCGTILLTLFAGAYLVAVLDRAVGTTNGSKASGRGLTVLIAPLSRSLLRLLQQSTTTEKPDTLNRFLAPPCYFALAALGLCIVPWSADFVPVDLSTGLVLWGAVEALATVVIFLYGWSANAHFPLLGAYRYAALGLSYILVSMFVLIGVALPAESLQLSRVVASQQELWNVLRQPLGLPLFLVVGLGLTFWGPLNFAASDDLHGGITADSSGPPLLVLELARRAMLAAFALIAASAFLGGWLGPWLPGPLWLVLKASLLLALLLWLSPRLPRVSPERFVTLAWVGLLPLAFLDLVWAGVEALW